MAGLIVSRMGLHAVGALLLMVYGACGLDGHAAVRLCDLAGCDNAGFPSWI